MNLKITSEKSTVDKLSSLAASIFANINETDDIMTSEDVRQLYRLVEKNEILSKYKFPQKPLGDGRWAIYVKDVTAKEGRRKLRAKTLDELKEMVYQFEKDGSIGKVRKTFKDVFILVQDEELKYVKSEQKKASKKNTINKNKSDYKRFFSETIFEKMYIDDISKRDIEAICLLNLERYDLKEKAFSSLKHIICSVYKYAYQNYMVKDNIFCRIDWKQPRFTNMLCDNSDVTDRGFKKEEVNTILKACHEKQEKNPGYIGAWALEFQIITSMRRGELPPLRISDIDYQNGYIYIGRQQLTEKKSLTNSKESFIVVDYTKNRKPRKYPLSELVLEFMDRFMLIHDKYYPDSEYLFPARNDNGIITNNVVYNFYRRVCYKYNIPISVDRIRGTHAFRRNGITTFIIKSNGNVFLASKIYGNSEPVADGNYYTGAGEVEEARRVLNS